MTVTSAPTGAPTARHRAGARGLHVERLPLPLRRWWFLARMRQVAARRRLARAPEVAQLPWSLWCTLCAGDAAAVMAAVGARARRPLTFVQVGANDGVSNDPLQATVRRHGWRGVLAEPLPLPFQSLMANYTGVPGLSFQPVAVGAEPGVRSIHLVDPRPGDPPWVGQLASFDRQVVLRHADEVADLADRVREVPVEVVTLTQLLERAGLDRVDVLHVDAEGHDLSIIDQVDPDAPWAPSVIVFEKKHLTPEDFHRSVGRLRHAGYHAVDLWPDQLLYRPDRLPWRA